MARRRAPVNADTAQRALGTDILDRILDAEEEIQADALNMISVDLIDPNPYQTRRQFDEASLKELASSIEAHGFYGHLLARERDGRYQIAYGERRLRASKLLGLDRLPLVVRDYADLKMMEVAITENVIREDLNPIEEAEGYQHLQNAGYSIRKISERVGKSAGHISMLLRLLEKSDVADSVRQERIGVREAHEIAKVEDPNQRRDLLDRTAQGELNREAVRQAVRLVQRQAEFEEPREVLVTTGDSNDEGEKGRYVTVDRSESDLTPEHELEDIDYSKPISWPNMYDPLPNLRASLRRLEKIRPDRFEDIDTFTMGDVSAALKEIIARAQHMLKQIEEPWEPPQEDDDN